MSGLLDRWLFACQLAAEELERERRWPCGLQELEGGQKILRAGELDLAARRCLHQLFAELRFQFLGGAALRPQHHQRPRHRRAGQVGLRDQLFQRRPQANVAVQPGQRQQQIHIVLARVGERLAQYRQSGGFTREVLVASNVDGNQTGQPHVLVGRRHQRG